MIKVEKKIEISPKEVLEKRHIIVIKDNGVDFVNQLLKEVKKSIKNTSDHYEGVDSKEEKNKL